MRTVTIDEAKSSISALLGDVRAGEEIIITDAGVPMARLAPEFPKPQKTFEQIVARMNELREGNELRGLTIQEMREEGRR